MGSFDEYNRAKDEVFRRIGRNVLLFQQVEVMLKTVLNKWRFEGTLSELKQHVSEDAKNADKRTLGQLIDPLVNFHLTPCDPDRIELPATGEIAVAWGATVALPEEAREAFRRELTNLVAGRNELVHHSLSRFQLDSVAGCRVASEELERQYHRLKPVSGRLRAVFGGMREDFTRLAEHLRHAMQSQSAGENSRGKAGTTVIGVDVGGPAKGFHAVALRDRKLIEKLGSRNVDEMAAWIRTHDASVVAIDAPCRWREQNGPARAAELQMAGVKISSSSTPTKEAAAGNAFYTWMLVGMELYQALSSTHPIYDGSSRRPRECVETFPQAVACALAREVVSAKKKNSVRRGLLQRWGLVSADFANIDEVDAGLCAVAADAFTRDRFHGYGDPAGGYVVVPSDWLPGRPEEPV